MKSTAPGSRYKTKTAAENACCSTYNILREQNYRHIEKRSKLLRSCIGPDDYTRCENLLKKRYCVNGTWIEPEDTELHELIHPIGKKLVAGRQERTIFCRPDAKDIRTSAQSTAHSQALAHKYGPDQLEAYKQALISSKTDDDPRVQEFVAAVSDRFRERLLQQRAAQAQSSYSPNVLLEPLDWYI